MKPVLIAAKILLLFLPGITVVKAQTSVVKQEKVTVKSSQVTREVDKITYRIRQSEFATGTKTAEIINKIPALSLADGGSDIRIKGRIKAEVYIDGKPAPANILSTLPVAAVKSIEVIENPNASVAGDADGGIINIVLRKDAQLSGGSLFLSAGVMRQLFMGGGNFMLSDKKIFWLLSANGQASVQEKNTDIERSSSYKQHSYTKAKPFYFNTHSDLFYKPDSTQQLSAVVHANVLGAGSDAYSAVMIPGDKIDAENQYSFRNRFFGGTAEYKKQHSKTRQYIITGGYQDILRLMNANNRETSLSTGKTGNKLIDTVHMNTASLQAVISRKDKKRKIHDWENGLMLRYEKATDQYSQFVLLPDENYQTYAANSNRFNFRKTVAAAYTQLKFTNKKKFQFSTGLRAEYAQQALYYPSTGKNNKRHFVNLFPTLGVFKALKNEYNLQFNYARRTRRPDITILSDFEYATGRTQTTTGNSRLMPELTDKLSASISRTNKGTYLDLSVYGSRKARPLMERTLYSSADSSVLRTIENFKNYYSGGTSFSFTVPVKEIFSVNGTVYAEAFHLTGNTALAQKHSGIIAGGNLNISASLKKKISIDGYISYSNYTYEYQQITRNYPLAALSVKKTALNNRLSISLSWMDVLNTGFNRLKEYNDGFITQLATETARNNNFVLSLTWNFGKTLRNSNRQKAMIAEDVKERKNND